MSGYRPEHDPILCAGWVRCSECGHTAYPDDAAWLPDGSILASFQPAPCGHFGAATEVVYPALVGPAPDWCRAKAAATGAPCRKRPPPGVAYCRWHDPARKGAR